MTKKTTKKTDQYRFNLSPERLRDLSEIREEVRDEAFDSGYREALAQLLEVSLLRALGKLYAQQEQEQDA